MIAALVIGAVAICAIGVLTRRENAAPARSNPVQPPRDADPVETLSQLGTPADAARLTEQGVDLGALGYRDDN